MGEAIPKKHLSFEEYEALEKESGMKYEFVHGEVFDMAGWTKAHNRITTNLVSYLERNLPVGCDAYSSDVKLEIEEKKLYVYPDIVVTCHPSDKDLTEQNVKNPSLVIEVLSESTEDYDTGTKRRYYFSKVSLQYYLLVSQKECFIECFERNGSFWKVFNFDKLNQVIPLHKIDLEIPISEIYRKINVGEIQ
jgi:Uma2 family endonuclease